MNEPLMGDTKITRIAARRHSYSLDEGLERTSEWAECAARDWVSIESASGKPVAATALNVKQHCFAVAGRPGRSLLAATERLAVQYGILKLKAHAPTSARPLLKAAGYQEQEHGAALTRAFPRRRTQYLKRITRLLEKLNLPTDYGQRYVMPLQHEAHNRVSIGKDIYGRDQHMQPGAARAWRNMQLQARADAVILQAVSAFRSVEYQAGIIRRKQSQGQSTDQILRTSAPPGFSEHHTARALDITTPGFDVLEEVFEKSEAFAWLNAHAANFGFSMSFPQNNPHGVAYEPWHWAWQPLSAGRR